MTVRSASLSAYVPHALVQAVGGTTALREEANVITLGGDDDQESGHNVDLDEGPLHGGDLLVDGLSELAFGDTAAEVDNSGRSLALTNLSRPTVLDERDDVLLNVLIGDHLDAVAIGLNSGGVASGVDVHRDSHGGHGRAIKTESSVRHIGTNDDDAVVEKSIL